MATEENLPEVSDVTPASEVLAAVPAPVVKKFAKEKGSAKVTGHICPGTVAAKFDGNEIFVIVPVNVPAPKVGSDIEIEADKMNGEIVAYLHKPKAAK